MKLSDFLAPKMANRFDYEKIAGPYLSQVSRFTLNRETGVVIIYIQEALFKFEINQLIPKIRIELSNKYPDLTIKKIDIQIDKRGSIKAKNDFIIDSNRKFVEKQNFYKTTTEEEQRMYDEIDAHKDEYADSEYLKDIAYMYFKTRDKDDDKECRICHNLYSVLIDGMCNNCLYREDLKRVEIAKKNIAKTPHLVNNSSVYRQARELLVEEKYENIFRYLDETEKIDKEYINGMILELAKIYTASNDEQIIKKCAINIKEKVVKGYEKSRKNT